MYIQQTSTHIIRIILIHIKIYNIIVRRMVINIITQHDTNTHTIIIVIQTYNYTYEHKS